jgi:hypothetical protein
MLSLRQPQPALAHVGESRAARLRNGRLREITDERTRSDFVAIACCPRRCPLWHLEGSQNVGSYELADLLTDGRYLPRPADSARSSTTDRAFLYLLARRIHQRALQLTAVAGTRASVSQSTRAAVSGPACGVSRLPVAAYRRSWRLQISRDNRYCETPRGTSAAAFVPDGPGRIGVPSP